MKTTKVILLFLIACIFINYTTHVVLRYNDIKRLDGTIAKMSARHGLMFEYIENGLIFPRTRCNHYRSYKKSEWYQLAQDFYVELIDYKGGLYSSNNIVIINNKMEDIPMYDKIILTLFNKNYSNIVFAK